MPVPSPSSPRPLPRHFLLRAAALCGRQVFHFLALFLTQLVLAAPYSALIFLPTLALGYFGGEALAGQLTPGGLALLLALPAAAFALLGLGRAASLPFAKSIVEDAAHAPLLPREVFAALWAGVKRYAGRALGVYALLGLLAGLLFAGILLCVRMAAAGVALSTVLLAGLLVLLLLLITLEPLYPAVLARDDASARRTLANTLRLFVKNYGRALLLLALRGVARVAGLYFGPSTEMLAVPFVVSLEAVACLLLAVGIPKKPSGPTPAQQAAALLEPEPQEE